MEKCNKRAKITKKAKNIFKTACYENTAVARSVPEVSNFVSGVTYFRTARSGARRRTVQPERKPMR
jgi:hypothetical protein